MAVIEAINAPLHGAGHRSAKREQGAHVRAGTEFAPARSARAAQGSFGNTMLPKPSCPAQWFWLLLPKQK